MRKFYQSLSFILLLLVISASACKPTPKNLLSRKWKPVDVSGKEITPDMKNNIIKEGNMMIEFTNDGRFISHAAGEATESGSYNLTGDGKTILITSPGRMEVKMELIELQENKAVIESNGITLTYEPVK